MTKEEFLSASLPYGLKVTFEADEYNHSIVGVECNYVTLISHFNDYGRAEIQKTIPIVRPLSDLTKECVQSDYNDGKPFVPIDELRYWAKCDADHSWLDAIEDDFASVDEKINVGSFHLVVQLIRWHFDLLDENCEKVYVTDEFNPYK